METTSPQSAAEPVPQPSLLQLPMDHRGLVFSVFQCWHPAVCSHPGVEVGTWWRGKLRRLGSCLLGSLLHPQQCQGQGWCCQRSSRVLTKVCYPSLSPSPLLSLTVAPCQHSAQPPGISHSCAWLTLYSPDPTGSFWFHSCLPFRHKTCHHYIFHSPLGCCFAFLITQDAFK